jgi:hypothetical protein
MMKNKKIALLASILVMTLAVGVFAATSTMWTYNRSFTVVTGTAAVQYTVLPDDLPGTIELDKEYLLKVQCKNTATIPYEVQAYLKVAGQTGFENNDIFVRWRTHNDTAGAWVDFGGGKTEFGIGHAPTGYAGVITYDFTNHENYWIDWTGSWSQINPGDTLTQYVYVTILGSAPTGGYSAYIEVNGQGV